MNGETMSIDFGVEGIDPFIFEYPKKAKVETCNTNIGDNEYYQGVLLNNITKAYEDFSTNKLTAEGLYTVIRQNMVIRENKYDKNIYQITEHRDALLERIEEYKRAAAGLIEQRDKALEKLKMIKTQITAKHKSDYFLTHCEITIEKLLQ